MLLEMLSDCHLPEKQRAHGCCNLALVAEMQRKWLGFPKDSLASFSILTAQVSSKICPSSCRLGGISLEIVSVGVWSGELSMKERKSVPLGWESARGGGVLRACSVCHQKNIRLCYHLAFLAYYFIFAGRER